MHKRWTGLMAGAVVALGAGIGAAQDGAEPIVPPPHSAPWPDLGSGWNDSQLKTSMMLGPELQRGEGARAMLAERRRLDAALDALQPQRPGVVDAYVVAVALDSDPVFAREAREAGVVLERRYDGAGRTLTLAGPDGRSAGLPRGSITSLTLALARIAELMDPREDVLVLYTTSHGAPEGLAFHEGDTGYGLMSPSRLRIVLGELGIRRRVLLLSACFSGTFVPLLRSPDTAIVTAAAADKTSFGCQADNDWTYFGDALINHALRKPQSLADAAAEASGAIAGWEAQGKLEPSQPQVAIGEAVSQWLPQLEARGPRGATSPVGTPAMLALTHAAPR